jgi:hypothetical protein
MRRVWILLLAAGCAAPEAPPTVEQINRAPTADAVDRLLRRRWPRAFVLEYCRPESRWTDAQRLVPLGDLNFGGVLYSADGVLGAVRWRAHRWGGSLSYELSAHDLKGEVTWVLEMGSGETLFEPLSMGEVVQDRVGTCVVFCGSESNARRVVTDTHTAMTHSGELLVWKSPEHGTLEAELDGNRDVRRLLLNGWEDVELNRAYRARAKP